jgi:hypothetical protein
MAELHTDDTFMWENKLMACPEEDYDRVPREERGVVDPLVNRITHQRGPKVSANIELTRPLSQQIGGEHYSRQRIQPVEFIHANDLGFCEGNCIKYVCRWKYKGGIQDLEKAKHYIEMLIDMEKGKNDE